ncbi:MULTISPECIES: hypothetical protein [unclassified Lysobacter]|uniref:hypothetical protein n=1 Tax=unclassified Lysobacter TaxID=2635362 RepID=UPI001C224B21|nr:hypothetical protein [Lysobacter sp. MMG2]MBU8975701.1 hypothetical protein [Lysobacter sp. MMG2]
MSLLPRIEWRLGAQRPGALACALLACVVLTIGVLAYARSGVDARLQHRERQLDKAMQRRPAATPRRAPPSEQRSATQVRQLQSQIALLNRDWVKLLQEIVPAKGAVRLLGVDVNATTAAIRITGHAGDSAEANAYAEALQARGHGLHDVRLLLLERKNGGIHFEVSARWAQ